MRRVLSIAYHHLKANIAADVPVRPSNHPRRMRNNQDSSAVPPTHGQRDDALVEAGAQEQGGGSCGAELRNPRNAIFDSIEDASKLPSIGEMALLCLFI